MAVQQRGHRRLGEAQRYASPVRPTEQASIVASPQIKIQPDAVSRVLAWIEREYLDDRVTYASTVNWYDKGALSRDAVLLDRAKYIASWPERRFTYIPGTLQ